MVIITICLNHAVDRLEAYPPVSVAYPPVSVAVETIPAASFG
jgi:hypothetical protein